MADDVASTLKWGFIVVALLLAGILFVLVNDSDGNAPSDRTPDQTRNSPRVGKSWSNALETRCRNLKGRLDAIDDEFAQLEREYDRGRYTEAEGSALQAELGDKESQLVNQIYDTCAPNQELWDYLRPLEAIN